MHCKYISIPLQATRLSQEANVKPREVWDVAPYILQILHDGDETCTTSSKDTWLHNPGQVLFVLKCRYPLTERISVAILRIVNWIEQHKRSKKGVHSIQKKRVKCFIFDDTRKGFFLKNVIYIRKKWKVLLFMTLTLKVLLLFKRLAKYKKLSIQHRVPRRKVLWYVSTSVGIWSVCICWNIWMSLSF